jgi:hypothetical protein
MDSKEIIEILQKEGLEVAEDMAVEAVRGAIRLIKAMLPKVHPILEGIIGPMLDQLEPVLLGIVDKIDGVDDPNY